MTDATERPGSRAERSRKAIFEATRELMAAPDGVQALTIEAVAARSGVAKTTIYRRWRDRWHLALDAVIELLPRFEEPIDVGDTRKELITFVDSVVRAWAKTPQGPVMQALVSKIATEPELSRIYRQRIVEPRRELLRPVIERGIARGDLRPGVDVRFVHELMLGPVVYRLLFSGPPLNRKLSEGVVDAVLAGFAPSPSAVPRKRARRSARKRASSSA